VYIFEQKYSIWNSIASQRIAISFGRNDAGWNYIRLEAKHFAIR